MMPSSSVHNWVFPLTLALIGMSWAAAGMATETAGPDQQSTAPGGDERPVLGEVIVTATKRAESMQDVPLSISVISGLELQQAGAVTFTDYAVHIPNLSLGYTDYFAPTAQSIAIRGVQGPNTTGMYVDDTPLPENLDPRVIDLSRIEVLRGPQGTLYGSDSMGGAVRIITNQPDPTASAGRLHNEVSYTNGGGWNTLFDGMFNLPLSQASAVRLVGFADNVSGVFNKLPLPDAPYQFAEQKGVDQSEHQGGSISGIFKFFDDSLTVTPRFLLERTHLDGLPYADTTPDNFSQYRLFFIPEPVTDNWNLGTLTIAWRTPVGEITSATSYFSRNASDLQDFSEAADLVLGAAEPTPATQLDTVNQTSTIEELRFASTFKGPFQITAGLFFEDAIKRLDTPPIAFGSTPNIFAQSIRDETSEYALYAEATYNLTSRFQVLAGARVYKTSDQFWTTESGTLSINGEIANEQSANGVSPKYGVNYSFSDHVMAYASAAKGFRLGGVNAFPLELCAESLAMLNIDPTSAFKYNSDSLWSYEVGVKSELADRRVRLNAAAYHIDWDDLQQNLQLSCGYDMIVNSGKARSNGGELEVDAVVITGLNASLGVGYEDAVITQSGTAIPAGTPVQQVPRWNVTASAQYEANRNFARLDFAYVGSSISTNNSVFPPYERGAYSSINVRLGHHFGKLDVTAFCDNVANRIGNLGDVQPLAIADPGRPQLAVTRPRTSGIDFLYQF